MSITVTQIGAPLFPLPVDERERATSTRQSTGQCARFCANDDVPTIGASVAEHGPKCLSASAIFATDLLGEDGRPAGMIGFLSAPYLDGVYDGREWEGAEREGYVTLSVDFPVDGGFAEGNVYMSAARARSIAAGMLRLADELELPDEPLRSERARREEHGQRAPWRVTAPTAQA